MKLKAIILLAILISIGLMIMIDGTAPSTYQATSKQATNHTLSSGVILDPIVLNGPQDFIDQGWPGDGTESNPFRVQNATFRSVNATSCIRIFNMQDKHFLISNCTVSGSYSESWFTASGIYLGGGGFGRIYNTSIYNCSIGLEMQANSGTQEYTVDSSKFWNCTEYSIYGYGQNFTISNNIVNQTFGPYESAAIMVAGGVENSHSLIVNNTVGGYEGNWATGMIEARADGTIIRNNTVYSGRWYALRVQQSANTVWEKNTVYSDFNPAMVTGAFNTTFIDCNFNPLNSNSIGILTIRGDSANTTFQDCLFHCVGMGAGGIETAANLTVIDCTFLLDIPLGGVDAIQLQNDLYGEVIVRNCSFSNYTTGVEVFSEFDRAEISFNKFIGCDEGTRISGSNITLMNNTFLQNSYGVRVTGEDNWIFYNQFLENTIHAYDMGENNLWDDDVSIGNYWDNYTGIGVYTIDGPAGSVDRYPIFYGTPPTTTTTTDTTTSETSSTTNTNTTTITIPTLPSPMDMMIILGIGGVVLVFVIVVILKQRRKYIP
ncbi:MAG: hypothetical protein RTV31_15730 [Candidatus Thorarchaeota archaeon]